MSTVEKFLVLKQSASGNLRGGMVFVIKHVNNDTINAESNGNLREDNVRLIEYVTNFNTR